MTDTMENTEYFLSAPGLRDCFSLCHKCEYPFKDEINLLLVNCSFYGKPN